jgi:hypothetical protein
MASGKSREKAKAENDLKRLIFEQTFFSDSFESIVGDYDC